MISTRIFLAPGNPNTSLTPSTASTHSQLDFQNKSLPSVWTQLNNFKILKFSYLTFCRLSRCKQKISKLDKAEFLQITRVFLWGNVWNIWVKLGVKYKPHVWHRWMQYISFLMSKLLPHSKVCLSLLANFLLVNYLENARRSDCPCLSVHSIHWSINKYFSTASPLVTHTILEF